MLHDCQARIRAFRARSGTAARQNGFQRSQRVFNSQCGLLDGNQLRARLPVFAGVDAYQHAPELRLIAEWVVGIRGDNTRI